MIVSVSNAKSETNTGRRLDHSLDLSRRRAHATGHDKLKKLTHSRILSTAILAELIALSLLGGSASSEVSAAPVVLDFENLAASGLGTAPTVFVSNQYADKGVTFNGPAAFDYSKGEAILGFAHSGTKAIEQCFGKEFCTTPIEMNFAAAQNRVKVWLGYSSRLEQRRVVVLRVFDSRGNEASRMTTLNPSANPQPIQHSLEVTSPTLSIVRARVEFDPPNTMNGLAVDDVEFEGIVTTTITTTSTERFTTTVIETPPYAPWIFLLTIVTSGVALIKVRQRNAATRKLTETMKDYERSWERSVKNQVRSLDTFKWEDFKRVTDAIRDSREVITTVEKLYREARNEAERNKITEETVRRIKANVDQVDSFVLVLTSIQNSLLRNESLSEEELKLASREVEFVKDDLEHIGDALESLNLWLKSAFPLLAKFGLVGDGYKKLALSVGFAITELIRPTAPGLAYVIEKISGARDIIVNQLVRISKVACSHCGAKSQADAKFCEKCGAPLF